MLNESANFIGSRAELSICPARHDLILGEQLRICWCGCLDSQNMRIIEFCSWRQSLHLLELYLRLTCYWRAHGCRTFVQLSCWPRAGACQALTICSWHFDQCQVLSLLPKRRMISRVDAVRVRGCEDREQIQLLECKQFKIILSKNVVSVSRSLEGGKSTRKGKNIKQK